jgi:hypothetical protein
MDSLNDPAFLHIQTGHNFDGAHGVPFLLKAISFVSNHKRIFNNKVIPL